MTPQAGICWAFGRTEGEIMKQTGAVSTLLPVRDWKAPRRCNMPPASHLATTNTQMVGFVQVKICV